MVTALLDGYELRLKQMQDTIDALVKDNERLALELSTHTNDYRRVIK